MLSNSCLSTSASPSCGRATAHATKAKTMMSFMVILCMCFFQVSSKKKLSTQKDSCLLFGIINVTDAFDNTPNVFYTILKFHLWSILNNKRFRGPTTDPQKSNQIIIHAKYIEKLHRAYYLYEAQLSPKWSDFCICRYTRSRVSSFFNRN